MSPRAASGVKKTKLDMTSSINPATGKLIAEYPVDSIDALKEIMAKARKAQVEWEKLGVKKRADYVIKIRDYIVENIDTLAKVISDDNGKTQIDALTTELVTSAMAVTYYCKNAPRFLMDVPIKKGSLLFFNKKSFLARKPFGVIGIISPWNYPFAIPFSEVVMGLLAGNAVVLKTAAETQSVGFALKKCVESAGLPDGIFNYVNMPGSVAGDAFLDLGVDKLFFTGSVPVGKYLMKKAAETLTPVSLELGGNDPMIVCEDADLERAAAGAVWAGFQNAGQSCGGVERIYVHEKIYASFLKLLNEKVSALRIGPGSGFDSDIGAMTTSRQIETVRLHINDALKKGAKISAESKPSEKLKGQFIPCVVLTEVNHDMLVMKDETFGPVVGVMKFADIDEAVKLANDSNLGLTASVWSKNAEKAVEIARRINAGAVTINDHLMSHGLPETPWGGFKQSGIGRTHGELGFAEMTEPQVIVRDSMSRLKKNFWWHPFDKAVYDGLKGALNFLYAKNFTAKISGIRALMKAMRKSL